MKILYLADIRFPLERANGMQTFETCRALAQRGHWVTLFVRRDTSHPARDPWTFYDAPRDEQLVIVRASWAPGPVRRLSYQLVAALRAMSRMPDVVLTRDLGVADALLRRGLHRLRAPIVYESHGYAPAVSAEMPRLLAGVPAPSAAKLARLTRRESRVWRRSDGYVTLTRVHQQELEDRFGTRRNAAVIPDGVRLARARTFPEAPDSSVPLAVYAGHLYPWKGVERLIDAVALVPRLHARIVGGQPGEGDRARLEARARERGVADRVSFTGWLAPSAVAGELARAHVLVLPNSRTHISERYTSPLKLFEYMAAGRPIVASDLSALREVLRHDDNAVLVDPDSSQALADGIARVLADPALADRVARRAHQDVADYGWEVRALRLEAVLGMASGADA